MTATTRATAKERRLQDLEAAQLRLKERGDPLSISAVAREAGVTPALIHNTYPDLAERLRKLQGRDSRVQLSELRTQLEQARADNQKLKHERDTAVQEARQLASMLEAMRFDLARLNGVAAGTVIVAKER